MHPESGSFTRCVRHPSQILTGICSFCLAERLSNVDSAERSPKTPCGRHIEIEEVAALALEKKPGDGRARKTLLSLFQLDDRNELESREEGSARNLGFPGNGCDCESGAAHPISCSIDVQMLESRVRPETRVSGSCGAVGDVNGYAKKFDPLEDKELKGGNGSPLPGSVFSRRSLRWSMRCTSSRKGQTLEQSPGGGIRDRQSESMPKIQHFCDWRLCYNSNRASWEVPRHSWDGGSMVSKAFACSLACLEERQDGSCRIRRSMPQETTTADPVLSSNNKIDAGKIDNVTTSHGNRQEVLASGINRKKSHRWSRVWDWSITNQFRDLVKKHEHLLQRSLSESCRQGRKEKSMETVDSDGRAQLYANGHGPAWMNQCLNRSMNSVNGNLHNFRLEWQTKKECKLRRSRSVHYSSHGNLENGLLCFYLTPIRSSRRNKGNGRRRTSHSFARCILGLH